MRDWIKQGSVTTSQLVRREDSDEWQRADRSFADLMDPRKAPDLLAQVSPSYFECDGFCFMPLFDSSAGKCRISLYCQNRYSRPCHATISLTPRPGFWPNFVHMAPVVMSVTCSGAEFGVIRRLCAVPREWQGEKRTFNITGAASYPNGRGDMLRFHGGIQVLQPDFVAAKAFRLLLLFKHIHVSRKDATLTCTMPKPVAEVVNEVYPPERETLWLPDMGSEGA